jgi:hypothetical protein
MITFCEIIAHKPQAGIIVKFEQWPRMYAKATTAEYHNAYILADEVPEIWVTVSATASGMYLMRTEKEKGQNHEYPIY